MLQAKNPKVVFDPYLYLPGYGESQLELSYKDGDLRLKVLYDDPNSNKLNSFEIVFEHAVFHRFSSCPGVDGMDIDYEHGEHLSSLTEYTKSDLNISWEKHFENMFKFRHFNIFFLSENKRLEIVSENFEIIPPLV